MARGRKRKYAGDLAHREAYGDTSSFDIYTAGNSFASATTADVSVSHSSVHIDDQHLFHDTVDNNSGSFRGVHCIYLNDPSFRWLIRLVSLLPVIFKRS